ncbi:hypothetical protein JTB14_016501 [Gonioctena quinquepunctata]|nr:hypothetical protein JTB14_016501 [Gonioctena quinquepunctata]
MELMRNTEAVRLLVNIYMIKKLKKPHKPVDQVQFIQDVHEEFSDRKFSYTIKEILICWKELLEEYHHYKLNFPTENAKETWEYFDLLDNCFDESQDTEEKFSDPDSTIYLIDCMSDHRETILTQGLTMDVLLDVENEFKKLENNNINQRDIYVQWNNLKKSYNNYRNSIQNESDKLLMFVEAMRLFFQEEERQKYVSDLERNMEDQDIPQ